VAGKARPTVSATAIMRGSLSVSNLPIKLQKWALGIGGRRGRSTTGANRGATTHAPPHESPVVATQPTLDAEIASNPPELSDPTANIVPSIRVRALDHAASVLWSKEARSRQSRDDNGEDIDEQIPEVDETVENEEGSFDPAEDEDDAVEVWCEQMENAMRQEIEELSAYRFGACFA
jgi:hypothetical protein